MPIKPLLNSTKALLLFLVLLAVSACTGSKSVVTFDTSVEYRNAVSLPPLKKPSQKKPIVQNTEQTSIQESVVIPTKVDSTEEEKVTTEKVNENQSDAETPVVLDIEPTVEIEEPAQSIVQTTDAERIIVEDREMKNNNLSSDQNIINARVIEPNASSARLQIEEGFTAAWDYISDNLKRSDITVYNKIQSAQRFAIGCADMEEKPQVVKRGGWSFFNRKPQKTEHCSLQLVSSKANTTVAVLSRSGDEVAASAAKELFARLLNN